MKAFPEIGRAPWLKELPAEKGALVCVEVLSEPGIPEYERFLEAKEP